MTLERIAVIGFCFVLMAECATGQTPSRPSTQQQPAASSSVIERVYPNGGPTPWRRVQSRNTAGGREVIVETLSVPGVDGELVPAEEIVTETGRGAPNTEQIGREVFGFGLNGRRTLLEKSESARETLPAGAVRTLRNTFAPDLNGHVRLTARQEESVAVTPNARESQSTLWVPDVNEPLRATGRTEDVERVVSPGQSRRDSTQLVRDINGRWQSIEVLHGEAREMGNERLDEETIERLNLNQQLAVNERSVTRRSNANGQERLVIETYAPYEPGSSTLVLRQRVQRTTIATADGGRSTVEEAESLNPGNPTDPMRITSRTVTTVRAGAGPQVTERQVFERDVNGRMRLIMRETEEGLGR